MADDSGVAWERVQSEPQSVDDPEVLGQAAVFESIKVWRARRMSENDPVDHAEIKMPLYAGKVDYGILIGVANEYITRMSERTDRLTPLDEVRAREVAETWLGDFIDDEVE